MNSINLRKSSLTRANKLLKTINNQSHYWIKSGDRYLLRKFVRAGLVLPILPHGKPESCTIRGQCCFEVTPVGRDLAFNGGF